MFECVYEEMKCWRVFCVEVSRDGRLWEQESQPRPRPHSLRIIRSLDGVRPESNVLFRLAHLGWRHTGTINWDLLWAGPRAESGPGKALNTVMNIRLRFQRYKSSESELHKIPRLTSYWLVNACIGHWLARSICDVFMKEKQDTDRVLRPVSLSVGDQSWECWNTIPKWIKNCQSSPTCSA